MAYQNVGTPRFYCDIPQLIKTLGISSTAGGHIPEFWQTNSPSSQTVVTHTWDADFQRWGTLETSFPLGLITGKTFIAILGHNFADLNAGVKIKVISAGAVSEGIGGSLTSVVNEASTGNPPEYNGFSIQTMDRTYTGSTCEKLSLGFKTSDATITVGTEFTAKFGQIMFGTYFELPHSPDLKLNMTRELDGVKRIRTKGGADLVNYEYIKPFMWGDAGAWELHSGTPTNQELSRSGRRVWDLSFSYLQDSDLFPDVSSLTNYETSGYSDGNDVTLNTLLNDNTFYSQVIHKTNGGQLPFIFQPDKDNNNPDQFAICKLDMDSFQFERVTKNIYNIKLKIREVW